MTPEPTECEHEDKELSSVDTSELPDVLYADYWCSDCGSHVSIPYSADDTRIVVAPSGDIIEDPDSSHGGEEE